MMKPPSILDHIPLRSALIVPFVLQIMAAVGLVGYLSYQSGQKSVENIAEQLMAELGERIDKHLDFYLQIPQQVNQLNQQVIESDLIDKKDFQRLGKYFWKQLKTYNFSYINYGNQQDEFIGSGYFNGQQEIAEVRAPKTTTVYSYKVDGQGNRLEPPSILEEQNPNHADWYSKAVTAGKPIWSPIYNWSGVPDEISISASAPVYARSGNRSNQLLGVVGIDLSLSKISIFLRSLRIGKSGHVFIIERSGLLVASSDIQKPYEIVNGKAHRIQLEDIKDPLIHSLSKTLKQKAYELQSQSSISDPNQFVQVLPYRDAYGIDWLIVIAIPKTDFTETIQSTNNFTVLLCGFTLLTVTTIGLVTASHITRPIQRLSRASQSIAEGEWQTKVPEEIRIQELNTLSHSFNRMAQEIRQTYDRLQITLQDLQNSNQQLQQVNAELKQASRLKDEFLAVISHELRTPLNAILGMAGGMQEQAFGEVNDRQVKALKTIEDRGLHLLSLIDDILDIAKISSGQVQLEYTSTSIASLCQASLASIQPAALEKAIQLSVQIPSHLPLVRVDKQRIQHVLIHLLENGIKFTPDRGCLKLEVSHSPSPAPSSDHFPTSSYLRITITDTGIGIAPEHIKQLFQPFVQVDGKLSRKHEGTGIGLAFVKQVVELHGGQVGLSSEVGVGSCFTIDLPCAMDTALDPPSSQSSSNPEVEHSEVKATPVIMLVEGNEASTNTVSSYLQARGYQMLLVKTGSEAIALTHFQSPNLILIDIQASKGDALKMIQELRSISHLSTVPIIILTVDTPTDWEKYLAVGVTAYLAKPVKLKQLVGLIQQHLVTV